MAAGPHLDPTIADHCQFDALAFYFAERIAQVVCGPARPIEKDVDADELFLRRRFRARSTCLRLIGFAVLPRLQNLRCLTQAFDYSFGKLLRPDLLFTDF